MAHNGYFRTGLGHGPGCSSGSGPGMGNKLITSQLDFTSLLTNKFIKGSDFIKVYIRINKVHIRIYRYPC